MRAVTFKIQLVKLFAIPLVIALTLSTGTAQTRVLINQASSLQKMVDTNFLRAASQYKLMMKRLEPYQFPKTFYADLHKFQTSGSGWWCSGFYPGTLFYLYEQSRDTVLLKEGLRMLKVLEKEKTNLTTHDLGFMMYCSFGNAQRIIPNLGLNDVLVKSAVSLASRFSEKTGCIRSWDSKDTREFKVIIDNMMNLELLFYATRITGDSSFYKIAVSHANTTMKNHFRSDFSSWHLVIYDGISGAVREKKTVQGYSDSSAWARGQGWGLYGFTVAYRETRDPRYLKMANNIAGFILRHPNLPEDKIPYWDFNDPGIPSAPRDASSAALIASALLELSQYNTEPLRENYLETAEMILKNLSDKEYFAAPATNGGFILKHSVGHLPKQSEVDVPLTYADYYFVEAMKRYKELSKP